MFSILKETFNIMTVVVDALLETMPPIKKVVPTKTVSRVWKFYGDFQDGEFAHCLLCKYNPNKGVDVIVRCNLRLVDWPQELKGDFCSCSPVCLVLLNK